MKTCTACGESKPLEKFYGDSSKPDGRRPSCRECAKAAARLYRQADPEKEHERNRQWRLANPGAMAAYGRKELAALRQAVFGHYGWTCACCGTTEALTADHIHGDGLGFAGTQLYRWLVTSGFPDGFQTLCLSCNSSKSSGERCRLDHRPACTHCGGSGKESA